MHVYGINARLMAPFKFKPYILLSLQVLAYIEDFKSERADRERAQGKILDLQEEVGRLQLQIRSQVREHTAFSKTSPTLCDVVHLALTHRPG